MIQTPKNLILEDEKKAQFIIMLGLQGAGKTTTSAKLALHLKRDQKKKVLLVSLDIYRPAAMDQLEILGKSISVDTLIAKEEKPAQNNKNYLKKKAAEYDVIIL